MNPCSSIGNQAENNAVSIQGTQGRSPIEVARLVKYHPGLRILSIVAGAKIVDGRKRLGKGSGSTHENYAQHQFDGSDK